MRPIAGSEAGRGDLRTRPVRHRGRPNPAADGLRNSGGIVGLTLIDLKSSLGISVLAERVMKCRGGFEVLLKWIRCSVTDPMGFDRGQREWTKATGIAGLIDQRGGWDTRFDGTAHVFAFWTDMDSHCHFLAGAHDKLAAAQAGTYTDVDVRLSACRQEIGYRPAQPYGPEVLRIAHCQVRPDRAPHFVEAQTTVWNPGMAQTPGFHGGVFAQRDEDDFLVLTQWESSDAHANYQRTVFPHLRERAHPELDLRSIRGYEVALDAAWNLPPAHTGDDALSACPT